MQQKQPWKQLKALANNVNFKFVPVTVAQNKGKAVGKKPAKDRVPAGLTPPIELDPAKLTVLEGTFFCTSASDGPVGCESDWTGEQWFHPCDHSRSSAFFESWTGLTSCFQRASGHGCFPSL